MSTLIELFLFLKERKKFFLIPIILLMVIIGGLLYLTSGTVVAPFIYAIF